MSDGLDNKDKRIEALAMEEHARSKGYQGKILLELQSSSTLENLIFSRPILNVCWHQEYHHHFRSISYLAR
jgi:uncharacterized SAM-binding protein YcdF (DUF218 family)